MKNRMFLIEIVFLVFFCQFSLTQNNSSNIHLKFSNFSLDEWDIQNSGVNIALRGISVSPINSNVVWIIGGSSADCGILRTTNGGATWEKKNTPQSCVNLYSIEAFDENICWFIANGGTGGFKIYKTYNGGLDWNLLLDQSLGWAGSIRFFDADNGFVVCDPEQGTDKFFILTSSNGGSTWLKVDVFKIPGISSFGEQSSFNMACIKGNMCWFGTWNSDGNNNGRVYYSTNRGYDWAVSNPIPGVSGVYSLDFRDEKNGVVSSMSGKIAKTTDNGISWKVTELDTAYDYNCIRYIPNSKVILTTGSHHSTYDGIVYLSKDDGLSWSKISVPVNTQRLFSLAASSLSKIWVIGRSGSILKYNGILDINPNWKFQRKFASALMPHGVVVDKDNNIWICQYGLGDSTSVPGQKLASIYIFRPDGSQMPFSPIWKIEGSGFSDELSIGGRGISLDNNGDILYSNAGVLYRIDYKTGKGKNKSILLPTSSISKASAALNGKIAVTSVTTNARGLQILNEDLSEYKTIDPVPLNLYCRTVEMSPEGKYLYFGVTLPSESGGFLKYFSATGADGIFLLNKIIDPGGKTYGFVEATCIDPTNCLWFGSSFYPNQAKNDIGKYLCLNTSTGQIVDSIVSLDYDTSAFDPSRTEFGRIYTPRGIAFSPDGKYCYTADFNGNAVLQWFNPIFVAPSSPSASTGSASSILVNLATLNGSVNLNGLSGLTWFEYGESSTLSTYSSTSKQILDWVSSSTNITSNLTNLKENTQYYFRIVAQTTSGIQRGSIFVFKTSSLSQPILTLGTSILSFTASQYGELPSSQTFTITNTGTGSLNWTVTTESAWLNIVNKSGTNNSIVTVQISTTNLTTLNNSATITIAATGATGSPQTINVLYQLTEYPSTINLSNTTVFPTYSNTDEYSSTDWRLIGLPGQSDLTFDKILSGSNGIDWHAYSVNSSGTDYIPYASSSDFIFSTGKAYWVIKKGNLTLSRSVPTVKLSAGVAEIPLHSGWNLITNPFSKSISWANVQSANNNIVQKIVGFAGAYTYPSDFDAYKGYFFDNKTLNLTSIKIPYALVSTSLQKSETTNPIKWQVNIELESGGYSDKLSAFGVADNAKQGLDELDFRRPISFNNLPEISFNNSLLENRLEKYSTDFRPGFDDIGQWNLRVESKLQFQLEFSGLSDVPNDFDIYLIDNSLSKYYNLRKDSTFKYLPVSDCSNFSIFVGKANLIKEKIESIEVPKEFELGLNYPNPFNPVTNIPIAIPKSTEVKIIIYNTLGKEIKTLYSGILPQGRFNFEWDAKSYPSGIYIYRLITSANIDLSRKMILIK